jgi:hypothetical protein
MPEIQASVAYSKDLSKSQTTAHNDGFSVFGSQNYAFSRPADYLVYVYNISEQEHVVSRPPLFSEMKLKGRAPSEEYKLVAVFPQPLNLPKGNVDSNEVDFFVQDTRRFVMDMINPDNLGINQDSFIEKSTSGRTNDLGAKGLFWSLNGPSTKAYKNPYGEAPTAEEVLAARKRLEKRYRHLLDQAKATEVSNPANLREILSPEHHAAAEYFAESFSWHSKQVRADYCPSCGEKMRAGAAFHKTEEGGYCVNDWDRTIKAGARTRAQAFEATEDPKYAPKLAGPVVATGTAEGVPKGTTQKQV